MSVTFNGNTKIIQVDPGVTSIDVQDVYSRWKDWVLLSDNAKWAAAFRVEGGTVVKPGQIAPSFFYLTNGWTVRPDDTSGDHTLSVALNLYSDPSTNARFTYISGVAIDNLASDSIIGTNELSAGDIASIAEAVWDEDIIAGHTTVGSAGYILNKTRHLERKVFVDTEQVANGDGTAGNPYNNIGDAIDYAEAYGIKKLVVYADITLDRNLKNFTVIGVGAPVIECNGQDLKKTEFSHCTMRGSYVNKVIVQESVLDDGFALNGHFETCALNGDLTCVDGGTVLLANCFSNIPGLARPTVSMNGAGSSKLSIRNYVGGITLLDCNNAADEVTIEMPEGKLTLDSTCTGGVISVRGMMFFTDNSNGSTVDTEGLIAGTIEEIAKIERNRWKIDNFKLTIYDDDGVTVFKEFDLKDENGNATEVNPYERTPV